MNIRAQQVLAPAKILYEFAVVDPLGELGKGYVACYLDGSAIHSKTCLFFCRGCCVEIASRCCIEGNDGSYDDKQGGSPKEFLDFQVDVASIECKAFLAIL